MFAVTNSPWSSPIADNVALLREALAAGQRTGEIIFTAYSAFHILKHLQHAGAPLDDILGETAEIERILLGIGDPNTLEIFTILRQSLRLLQGLTPSQETWDEEGQDEAALVRQMQDSGHVLCLNYYDFNKMQAALLFRRLPQARQHAEAMEASLAASFGWFSIAEHAFYQALILLAEGELAGETLAKIETAQERLSGWAAHCPENFAHKRDLVAAERARREGRADAAMDLYELPWNPRGCMASARVRRWPRNSMGVSGWNSSVRASPGPTCRTPSAAICTGAPQPRPRRWKTNFPTGCAWPRPLP